MVLVILSILTLTIFTESTFMHLCDTVCVSLTVILPFQKRIKRDIYFYQSCKVVKTVYQPVCKIFFLRSTTMIEENVVFCQHLSLLLCNTSLKNCHLTCRCFEEIHAEVKHVKIFR